MPEGRLFLERRSYRKRRIMDAVRMLPFLCALLWIVVPAMWPTGVPVGTATPLSTALWYIFTIWVLAITASFALWRRIGGADDADSVSDAGRNT
jgi:hypothetical protein